MIVQRTIGPVKVKLNTANVRVSIPVGSWELARLYSFTPPSVTWATAIFDIKQSVTEAQTPQPLDSTQTLGPGDDMTTQIDVSTVKWLWLTSNTLEGSGTAEGDVYCVLAREE